ncbi:MAG: alpha/beta fold hydrolase [Candidatus Pristimantibacillus sp.]
MNRIVRNYTTKKGYNIEYSVIGEGEPLLVMHGGHSNCNEILGYREFTERGYSIITPSRPGYGNTSKEAGANITVACEAYCELLDYLNISQVHIVAVSAGGPSGIHFAAGYPHRVKSLILESAVSHTWLTPNDRAYKAAQFMFSPSNEKYIWAIVRFINKWFPHLLFKSMIASFSTRPIKEVLEETSEGDLYLFKQMLNRQRSGNGFLIDLEHSGQDLKSVLSVIKCPTLIMHSVHDASVSMVHAHYAHQYIPDSQLCELDAWGHLIWLGKGTQSMYNKLFVFLEKQV